MLILKQPGTFSPQALLRTVWLNNTMFFGWRARDEHRRVTFGDFQVNIAKYVGQWVTERGSKTRPGESEFVPDRPFSPKMFPTGGPKCPVFAFEEYVRRRPVQMNYEDAPIAKPCVNNLVREAVARRELARRELARRLHEGDDTRRWFTRSFDQPHGSPNNDFDAAKGKRTTSQHYRVSRSEKCEIA